MREIKVGEKYWIIYGGAYNKIRKIKVLNIFTLNNGTDLVRYRGTFPYLYKYRVRELDTLKNMIIINKQSI